MRVIGPAYRVETARLCLRCFEPSDGPSVNEALSQSIEHLRPFMSWAAREPLSYEERLTYLRTQRGHFDLGGDYHFGVFAKGTTTMLGAAALVMNGQVDEREVGYWIRADSLRMGLASEAVSALVRIAFDVEAVDNLDLRMDPSNRASAGLARKLCFHGPTVDPLSAQVAQGETRDVHVYSLPRTAYAASQLKQSPLEAFDVVGRRIL